MAIILALSLPAFKPPGLPAFRQELFLNNLCGLSVFVVNIFSILIGRLSLFVELSDQFYFSFQLYPEPLPDLVFDFANQAQDIGSAGIIHIEDKSGVFGTDHGTPDALAF
jgi:hypothetical protein